MDKRERMNRHAGRHPKGVQSYQEAMDVPRERIANAAPRFPPSSYVHVSFFFSLSIMLLDDVLHRESLDILFKTNTNTIALVQLTNYGVLHMKLNTSFLMLRGGHNVFFSLAPFTFHWMCVRSLPSDSVLAQDRYSSYMRNVHVLC